MSHKRHHSTPNEVVANVARQYGIPPRVAWAIGRVESGNNPYRVGDNGTSFGYFQLHEGGELGNHSEQWAFNVRNNAETSLSRVAAVRKQHPDWSWGRVAAAAQRPADQAGYARKVDAILGSKTNFAGGIGNMKLSALTQPAIDASGGTSYALLIWVGGFILLFVLLAKRR